MPKKIIPINYTDRDFSDIRESLLQHAKRYYPDTYKDFNEASFGSLMIDTVSYVGDVLSFYLDYQANESFFQTANEYGNVLKLADFLGYKYNKAASSYGVVMLYALVPAGSDGSPDLRYAPTLRAGSRFVTAGGVPFSLINDVSFADTTNEIIVAKVNDDTGAPTYFAIKTQGTVRSGELQVSEQQVGNFRRFLRLKVPGANVSDIVAVFDSDGHEYLEVAHLSQNTILKPIINRNSSKDSVPNLLKRISVPRRFSVEHLDTDTYINFGYGSDSELVSGSIAEPSNVVLKRHAREYISDTSMDPAKLTSTDKFGVAPQNTTLSIVYRTNTTDRVNAGANTLNRVASPIVDFNDAMNLQTSIKDYVINSIEVNNEEPIVGDVSIPTTEELKTRALANFAAQNRAVTKQDYISMTYAMPSHFGSIKRCTIMRDEDSFKRNLNLYVISENAIGGLAKTNDTIKQNLKTWLNEVRMINDTVDILDAQIINVGVTFEIVVDETASKNSALRVCQTAIEEQFSIHKDIGEPLIITDLFRALKDVESVVDVVKIEVVNKSGAPYSELIFNIDGATSTEGRIITPPRTSIFEIKYPDIDIKGRVV